MLTKLREPIRESPELEASLPGARGGFTPASRDRLFKRFRGIGDEVKARSPTCPRQGAAAGPRGLTAEKM
jgi:hypothetical protein